jgi:hypothetical protein
VNASSIRRPRRHAIPALAFVAFVTLAAKVEAQVVRSGYGDLAAVTAVRDQYRLDLGGGTTAGSNGSFGGLRREINWDGAPDARSMPFLMPVDQFFARGVLFAGADQFAMSAKVGNPTGTAVRFGNLDATYATRFAAFTAERLFASLDTPTYDIHFFVPGTSVPGVVSGFGAVFTDVDLAGDSKIEYFDESGDSLGTWYVPAAPGDATFSFLGVSFPGAPSVARVRVTAGTVDLGGGGEPAGEDAVAVDDFLYGEPAEAENGGCIPTPTALCLAGERFRVEATFNTAQTGTGTARVVPLNSNSGTMTFFSPEVSEVLIKVLDACSTNDRFWVYGAAATDVGYDILVTDTVARQSKTYSKTQGPPAAAITDSDAFATCD